MTEKDQNAYFVDLLCQIKKLAADYYRLTGRPLGVTGEIAEYEAIRLLHLTPAIVRQAGYDAIRHDNGSETKVQIKGRCLHCSPKKSGPRLGEINLLKEWDVVMFVALDMELEATAIYEVGRETLTKLINPIEDDPNSAKSKIPVRKFVQNANQIWQR
ncbi:MAG TPA: hypothetical protein VHS31_16790 [Tepidisphaeraceae bacterium]|jgi:hypothetical protein|nr:hypothetical protein [Tepidisphaeraceae bacterium]